MTSKTETPPPLLEDATLTFPTPLILLVTINRPNRMNSIPTPLHHSLDKVFTWFDNSPTLRVAIITGAGSKAFCAGQDLIELGQRGKSAGGGIGHPPSGFAGLSRRKGKKPVLAAVNGFAFGGGFEIVLNCDCVIAAPEATFALPEAQRGLYAAAGGLPRLVRNCGLQVASEIAMTGRRLTAQEAKAYGLVNKISKLRETVVEEAIKFAEMIARLSPDAIIVTRAALRETWETASVERAYEITDQRYRKDLFEGDNVKEGLAAFAEKRQPRWKPSKL